MKVLFVVLAFSLTSAFAQAPSKSTPDDSTMSGASDSSTNETHMSKADREEERLRASSMGGAPNAGAGMGTGTGAGSTVGNKIKTKN